MQLNDPELLQTGYYLNGQWQTLEQTYAVNNPFDDDHLADVACCGKAETEQAIRAAHEALPQWRALTATERGQYLQKWAQLMHEHSADLARIMTLEQGKPLAEAEGEVKYAAGFLEWFAEEAKRVYGDIIPSHKADARILVHKTPIGVCAAITPWNFPLAMITRKAGAALAAGCTLVAKPASATPLSAMALVVLAGRAGIPAGVFNLVSGDTGAIVEALMASDVVRKLSFTGSTEVGKKLMAQSAATMKKLSLELGGNAPFIVFDDADLDAAVEGAMASKFRNAGQTCVCANRFLIQEGVYDAFIEKFKAAIAELKTGNGLEAGVTQGPLINEDAVEKVQAHIQDALEKGAQLVTGGQRVSPECTLFEPTLMRDVSADMLLTEEETFGPLAACMRFSSEAEALALANATDAGLAAYFYSRDVGRIWRVAEGLEYGIVGINEGLISTPVAPFGGVKASGLGREGSYYGIEEYLEPRYLLMGGLDA